MYQQKYEKYKREYIKFKGGEKIKYIYLIRHGETNWNLEGKGQGQEADIALNYTGREQAKLTGEYLKQFRFKDQQLDCIYSSPLQRTKETAEIISDVIGYNKEIKYKDGLKERKIGELSGIERDDPLNIKIGEEYAKLKLQDPIENYIRKASIQKQVNGKYNKGFENEDDLELRATNVLNDIMADDYNNIIIVSHSGLLYGLIRHLFKIPLIPFGNMQHGSNCWICLIKWDDNDGYTMLSPPDTQHLALIKN